MSSRLKGPWGRGTIGSEARSVSSLYTNIPHEEGISACGEALTSHTVQEPPTHDIIALINYFLKKNNFVFGDKHYLQVHGTAMNTRMAPSMQICLCQSWRNHFSLVQLLPNLPCGAHPTITFTANWSYECIPFLDTLVILKDGTLFTDLYTKNTDTHQSLQGAVILPPPPLARMAPCSLRMRGHGHEGGRASS